MAEQGWMQAPGSAHEKHCERPDTLAKKPGPQQLHDDWPMTGLNVPGAQGLHCDVPMMEWEPAGHTVYMSTAVPSPSKQSISNQ
jgi:hypothetical protein